MGALKRVERVGKRLLIKLLTSVVNTPSMTTDQVLAQLPRRILVIRQHNQMGDMLLAVPAFRAVKESIPGARVGVLTARINRDVLLNNPYVDHVITYNVRNPIGWLSLIHKMRRNRYDLVIILHTVSFSFTSAALGLLSGARIRIGSTSRPFGNSLSNSFYHLELPLPSSVELQGMNEAEHNLYPLAAVGIRTEDLAPLLVPTVENRAWAESFLADHARPGAFKVVVHPGAGKTQNIWSPQRFAEVVNLLAQKLPINVFVIEGPRDRYPVATFCGLIEPPHSVLRGRQIGEVAAVAQESDLVVCNDTGVMHVSCASGATTLAVFGPTDPMRWAPRCSNLHVVRAGDGNLQRLAATTVFDQALSLLRSGVARQ